MLMKFKRIFMNCKDRSNVEINIEELNNILKTKNVYLIDVRSSQEYNEGHLNKAINIPLYNIDSEIDRIIINKRATIILYCQTGSRSKKAVSKLKKKGYVNVYNLKGGLDNI